MAELHSNISPSQAERFFNCPGSVKAQALIKIEPPTNPAGFEGTAIHEFASQCLTKNLDPDKMVGSKVEVYDQGKKCQVPVTNDFVFTVKMYLRYIDRVLAENGIDRSVLQVESKFTIPEVDKDARGTTDCSFIAGDTLYVIDLKSGRGILVDPEENRQCMYYALRPFFDAQMFVRKIKIVIVQPRAKDGDYIKEWETTPNRLLKFAEELKAAIAETRKPNAQVEAGSWCSFCKAAGVCGGLQKSVLVKAQRVLPSLDKTFPAVRDLTPEQIGQALPALELLKVFMESLYGYASVLAANGTDIPNYTLTRGKKQRRWNDEESVKDELYEEFGESIFSRSLLSPAQMEKLVGKERVADYIFTPEGDLKLVLQKEVQDEIKRKVEDVFKDVQID